VRTLVFNAYYIDALYHWLFEKPAYALADAFARFVEPAAIGGLPRAFAWMATLLGDLSQKWETGYLRRYGLTIVVGVALLLLWYLYVTRGSLAAGTL
jgi:NADH-quinone oxidoreductase subunit L